MRRILTQRFNPPTIPASLVLTLTITFAVLSAFRGFDWLVLHREGTIAPLLVDTVFGLRVWGGLLLAGALALLTAIAARRHFAVWCGHAWMVSTYTGITLVVLQSAIVYEGGIQAAVAPIGGVVWHGVLSWRMKPVPRAEHGGRRGHQPSR